MKAIQFKMEKWLIGGLIIILLGWTLARPAVADEPCPHDDHGGLTAEAAARIDCTIDHETLDHKTLDHKTLDQENMTIWPLGDLLNPAGPIHAESYRIQGQIAAVLWRSQQIGLVIAQFMGHGETQMLVLGTMAADLIRPAYIALFGVSVLVLTQGQAISWFGAGFWGDRPWFSSGSLMVTLLIVGSYLVSPLVFLQLSEQIRGVMETWGNQIGQELGQTLEITRDLESSGVSTAVYTEITPHFEINLAASFLGITNETELYRESFPDQLQACCLTYIGDPFGFGLLAADQQIWHKEKLSLGLKRLGEGGLFLPFVLLARGAQFLLVSALLVVWLQLPWDFSWALWGAEDSGTLVRRYIGRYGALWREAFFNALFLGMVNGVLQQIYQQLTAVHLFGALGISTVVAAWRFRATWRACRLAWARPSAISIQYDTRHTRQQSQQSGRFRPQGKPPTQPASAASNPYLQTPPLRHHPMSRTQNRPAPREDWPIAVTPLSLDLRHEGESL